MIPQHAVVIAEEIFDGISGLKFSITLVRPTLVFDTEAIVALYAGNTRFSQNLQTYLLSRNYQSLRSEFQSNNGKIKVNCIVDQPEVEVVVGQHVFLTVADHLSKTNTL